MSTPNAGIPYVPEDTIDPAAGLNLALNVIDALLQVRVLTIGDAAPPGSPADGDRHIVGVGTGDWAGHDDELARYVEEGDFWQFYPPGIIASAFNEDDGTLYGFNASWAPLVPTLATLAVAVDDAAAAIAGVPVGGYYRNGSVLMIRVA